MGNNIEKQDMAYDILKSYKGNNPYMIWMKNGVFAYRNLSLNDMHIDFIINNKDFEPVLVNKLVKVADWWGESKKTEWNIDFAPQKIYITYFLGETKDFYVFYCVYRQSQDKAKLCVASKRAILTDFLSPDFNDLKINFQKYNEKSGRTLYPYQEEGVKFLVCRKKAILASEMGSGKSSAAVVASLEDNYSHILIICPSSVKLTWVKELSIYVDPDEVTVVEGSKWKDNKYTIINYDILDNFYEIPTETVKKRDIDLDENGNVKYVVKDKEVVSRKKDIIKEAMDNSQLFQSRFDLIIIDEAHRLSNNTSQRTKIVTDLVKRSNPRGIYELTGTPITNRPINFYNLLKIINAPVVSDWSRFVTRYCDGKQIYVKKQRDAYTKIFLQQKHKNSWYDLSYSEKQELDLMLSNRCKKIWLTQGASNLEELQEVIKPYYLRRLKSDFGKVTKKTVKLLKYKLTDEQKSEYDRLWDDYQERLADENAKSKSEKYRKITEATMLRQWLAKEMTEKTIDLAKKCVAVGRKVVIFCAFDEELYKIQSAFGEQCVIHNGKIDIKEKEKSVERFQNDDSVKVFVGNLVSSSVGLTLTAGTVAIFNSFSWVSGENNQAEDRIHRLNQTKDVTIYYQLFDNTFFEEMFDKVMSKQQIIDKIIVTENEK